MSDYQLGIDGSAAETGARKIVKSFDDIKAAADRMENGVSAAARKASSSFNTLANTRGVSPQVVSAIRELSSVMSNFKGPSSASVTNALNLLNGLKAVGSLRISSGGVAGLLGSLSGYKGPSGASATNTTKLLGSLGRFGGIAGSLRGVLPLLGSLSGFKGPSSAASRNVSSLLAAIQSFKAPAGLAGVARAFEALAASANRASAAIGKIKTLSSGATNINVNTRQASGGLADLTKQHGLLQNSVLKTNTVLRSFGSILALRSIYTASNDILRIKSQLEAATGSTQQAAIQFEKLTEMADRMGLEFVDLAKSYGFFLGSIKGTNVTFAEAEGIFRGFSTAARALQLSTSDVEGVFRALGQIMSKGKLQAEELRGQLGDRLPGAFVRFARALDLTKPGELDDALKRGAISGDRLKKALIEVASTLEQEFAVSADKASQNVASAFARLKNAFVFTSADFGKSGLNDFLISLADGIRKFAESSAVNTALKGLGSILKVVGDNIELVARIAGGLAVFAFLKFVTTIKIVTASLGIFSQYLKAMAFAQAFLGVSRLTSAFLALNFVMKANVIGIVITALSVLTFWLLGTKKRTDEFLDNLNDAGAASAVAANGVAAFTAELADNNGKLDVGNQLLRERIRLQQFNQQEAFGRSREGLKYVRDPGAKESFGITGYRGDSRAPIPIYGKIPARKASNFVVDSQGNRITDPVIINYLRNTGGIGTNAGRITGRTSEQATRQYKRLYAENSRLGASLEFIKDPKQRAFAERKFNETAGYLKTVEPTAVKLAGGVPLVDTQAARDSVFTDPDRNRTNPIISGDVPEKGPKGPKAPKGPSDAGNVQDIRSAMNAIRDLNREITASDAAIKALSEGSSDAVAVQAKAAAIARVDNFSDSFSTVEAAASGLVRLAGALKLTIGPGQDARKVLVDYVEAIELEKLEKDKSAEVASTINSLKIENAARRSSIEAIAMGGQAMEEANIQLEVEAQLIGTSIKNREDLRKRLTEEAKAREELNRATEQANLIREARSSAKVESEVAELYGKGYRQEELDYYRELYEYRQKLINDGYTDQTLRDALSLKQASLDLADATRRAAEEEEKLRQLASDQADAVVGAFKEGIESGQSFLKTMKNIFNDLKNILLDFVLYNPLREYLRDIFASSGPSNSKAGGVLSMSDLVGDASNRSKGGLASGIAGLTGLLSGGGSLSTSVPSSPTQIANSDAAKSTEAGVAQGLENGIVVTGFAKQAADIIAPITVNSPRQSALSGLTALGKAFGKGDGAKTISKLFKSGEGGFSEKLSGAMKAAGQAFAAFSAAKGIAKALGAGRTGSNIAGGAAAGFSLGGPIGAAIGAVAGLGFSLLTKKKISSAYSNVSVGANGIAAGISATYGNGKIANADKAGRAGSNLFNQFAIEYDASLKAGDFGTFGLRKFKGDKEKSAFYSATGQIKKGKPVGVEGVDYVKGTDSEVQAFALRSQIKSGQIQGLSRTLQTVGTNSTAKTMEELQQDFAIGRSYDEFIRASFAVADTAEQVRTLGLNTEKLRKQAALLGLEENKISAARDRIIRKMKKDFDFTVNQGILGITDPRLEAFNALEKEYRDTVENGLAVGGDLLAVEKLFGMKRVEIAKQVAEQQANVYQDLLTSLTASSSSPLNADTILTNAQDRYRSLQGRIKAGDLTEIDKLGTYTENYLSAAREVNASGSGYFDIFNEVTSFLSQMSAISSTSSSSGGSALPSLPSLDEIVAEITARNQELIDVQNNIGVAIVEGTASNVTELQGIGGTLDEILAAIKVTNPAFNPALNTIYGGGFLNLNLNSGSLV